MSEENVEAVRKTVEYWNRGDLEAFLDLVDEDQVIRTAEGWPERVVTERTRSAPSVRQLRRRWAAKA